MIKTIEVTTRGVDLKKLEQNLSRPKKPLSRSADFMLKEARRNFPAKGSIFGEKWPPLTEFTKRIKAKYYPGQPMMVRTGLLRGSFLVVGPRTQVGKGEVDVYNPIPYAGSHQMGVGRLPRRVLLKLAKMQVDNIVNVFVAWVGQMIKASIKEKTKV